MQALRTTVNEDNRFITYLCQAHGSNTLTPQTKQANYSAMDRENIEITDEENMSESIIKSKEGLEIFSKGCRDSSPLTRVQVFSLQNLSKK